MQAESRGARPGEGLICSNHLSYLDILVYASLLPCVFVSKREVRSWPLFGWLARCGGTIFLDRQSRTAADEAARQMMQAMQAGVPVLLFPEGTSTDGSTVLRFHPSLMEPAVQLGVPMRAAAIAYPGGAEREVCWYGEAAFVPHLLRVLGTSGIAGAVEFYPDVTIATERKAAALALWENVQAMRIRMQREQ